VTGSSQSTAKRYQDTIFYPSAILSGEAFAIVTATGSQTQFSRKASSGASTTDDFGQGSYVAHLCDRVMTAVTATAIAITFVVYVASFYRSSPITTILQFTLGIAIAGIPMGLRATLETIVAVGAAQLARHDAILQNPEVLLDLATFDILLFDELSLLRKAPKVSRPFRMEGVFLPDILLAATLASVSKPELSREDRAIIREARRDARVRRKMSDFKPLLTSKYAPRSLLSYDIAVFRRLKDGAVCQYIKGPPLAILQALEDDDLYSSTSTLFDYLPKAYKLKAEEISNNGNIAIGVAQKLSNSPWHILGLLSITPRLRDDSLYAVRKAWSLGLNIKMLSHHSVPFACTTARSLGLNAKIFDPQKLGVGPESQGDHGMTGSEISSFVDVAGGFAEAEPIHRSYLLQMLDRRGHIIAYAGKDSNEVNVLHDAHVRISAHGASDIIRAAADLVMVAPGLLATVNAIGDCQQILRRMEAYVLYRLAFSLFLQLFLGLWVATLGQILNLELLVFVAVFAEVSAIPTAYDPSPGSFKRESWSARGTFRTALILALILIGGSLIAFSSMATYHDMRQTGKAVAQSDGIVEGFGVPDSVVFLELCLTGTWLNAVTRSDGALWKNLPPWRFSATILTTNIIASLFCVFGWFVEARTSITTVVRVWVFSLGVTLAVSLVFFLERRGLGNIFRSFEQLRRTHGPQEFATERKQRHGQRHKQRSLEDFGKFPTPKPYAVALNCRCLTFCSGIAAESVYTARKKRLGHTRTAS